MVFFVFLSGALFYIFFVMKIAERPHRFNIVFGFFCSDHNEKYDNLEPQNIETHVEVELPLQNDKGFSDFFSSAKKEKELKSEVLDDCDFDLLLPAIAGNRHNSKLQHHKKEFAKTRNVRRRKPPTKNPLKALAERSDIRQSYIDTTVMANDSEIKTLQIDTTKKHALAETSK